MVQLFFESPNMRYFCGRQFYKRFSLENYAFVLLISSPSPLFFSFFFSINGANMIKKDIVLKMNMKLRDSFNLGEQKLYFQKNRCVLDLWISNRALDMGKREEKDRKACQCNCRLILHYNPSHTHTRYNLK